MNISPECEFLPHCHVCQSPEASVHSRVYAGNDLYLQKVLCRNCGLIYSQVRPKFEYALEHLYSHTQFEPAENPLENRRVKRYRNIGSVLKKICPESKTLLDVGTGTGVGTNAFQDMGWTVTGIEPDTRSALAAKNRHQKIEILPYTIEEYNKKSDQQFDLVTFIQSLEHIYDPKSVLSEIAKKVKDKGHLYIEVPDICNMGLFDYTHLAHVSYFNFQNLTHLMSQFGFAACARLFPKSIPFGSYHLGVVFQKHGNAIAARALGELTEPQGLIRSFRPNLPKPYVFKTDAIVNILNDLRCCRLVRDKDLWVFDFTRSLAHCPSKKNLITAMLRLFLADPARVGSYVIRKVLVKLFSKFFTDPDFETVKYQR